MFGKFLILIAVVAVTAAMVRRDVPASFVMEFYDSKEQLNDQRETTVVNDKQGAPRTASTENDIRSLKKLTLNDSFFDYVPPGEFRGSQIEGLRVDYNRLTYPPVNFNFELLNGGARLERFRFCCSAWQCIGLLDQVEEVKRLGVSQHDGWAPQVGGTKPACVLTVLPRGN